MTWGHVMLQFGCYSVPVGVLSASEMSGKLSLEKKNHTLKYLRSLQTFSYFTNIRKLAGSAACVRDACLDSA